LQQQLCFILHVDAVEEMHHMSK